VKYIHKIRLGLEHCFTDISPLISLLGEFSPEDIMGQLMERPVREQNEICKKLFHLLRQLLQSDFPHKELIPENVKRVAASLIAPDAYSMERILPILLWIEQLRLKNEQDKVQWISNLHGTAATTDPMTAAFFENFPQVDAQRVSVIREGDAVRIRLPEKKWGRISLLLPEVTVESEREFPLFGYLFVLEAEAVEDRFQIRLLLDLEFSETPYQQRLLSEENWAEFSLSCDRPRLELSLYDYTKRIHSFGWGHIRSLNECCDALQSKFSVLGRSALNEEENRLLILSQLFSSAEYLAHQADIRTFEWNVSALENRFGLNSVMQMLEKQGSVGQRFAALLHTASEAFEQEENERVMQALLTFSRVYNTLGRRVSGCRFAAKILRSFSQATESYIDGYMEQAPHEAVRETLREYLGETLEGLGFSGALPHYTRRYGRSVHYLSFVLAKEPYITDQGELVFPYSLSIARAPLKAVERLSGEESLPDGELYAEDFEQTGRPAKFGRLATEEDAGCASFGVKILNSAREIPNAKELSQQLEYHLLLADNALKDQPLNKAYRATRRRILRRSKTLRRLAIPIMLSSLASAAAVGYWMVDKVFDIHHTKLTVSGFTAAAIIMAIAVLFFLYWRKIRSIWTS